MRGLFFCDHPLLHVTIRSADRFMGVLCISQIACGIDFSDSVFPLARWTTDHLLWPKLEFDHRPTKLAVIASKAIQNLLLKFHRSALV
jgi:hypothetical protein